MYGQELRTKAAFLHPYFRLPVPPMQECLLIHFAGYHICLRQSSPRPFQSASTAVQSFQSVESMPIRGRWTGDVPVMVHKGIARM